GRGDGGGGAGAAAGGGRRVVRGLGGRVHGQRRGGVPADLPPGRQPARRRGPGRGGVHGRPAAAAPARPDGERALLPVRDVADGAGGPLAPPPCPPRPPRAPPRPGSPPPP